jgi:hypothetical protein
MGGGVSDATGQTTVRDHFFAAFLAGFFAAAFFLLAFFAIAWW